VRCDFLIFVFKLIFVNYVFQLHYFQNVKKLTFFYISKSITVKLFIFQQNLINKHCDFQNG